MTYPDMNGSFAANRVAIAQRQVQEFIGKQGPSHADAGGSDVAMSNLNHASEEALKDRKGD